MYQLKESILKFKERKYFINILIMLSFLTVMCTAFYISVTNGRPNLTLFLIVVIGCFTVITLFLARHLYIGLVIMIVALLLGYFCDLWGVGNNLWLYEKDTITLYILNGGDLTNGGFPIEIVAAYFFAGMWLMQIIESLFDKEIEELIEEYNNGAKLINSPKQMIPAIIVIIISTIIIIIEPLYWESLGYFSIGVFMISLVPSNKKIIPIIFGVFVGLGGFFFELFCSGQIFPEAVIWTYQQAEWEKFAIPSPLYKGSPISAIYAYFGVGAILASTFLLLLKFPVFRKEITIITIKK
ncbi:MAG: hypothetical protein ACTSR8_14320 [Promethearchaeota archaeon]